MNAGYEQQQQLRDCKWKQQSIHAATGGRRHLSGEPEAGSSSHKDGEGRCHGGETGGIATGSCSVCFIYICVRRGGEFSYIGMCVMINVKALLRLMWRIR